MLIRHLVYLLLLHSSVVVSRSAFYFSNRSPTLRRSGSSFYNPTPSPPPLPPLSSDTVVYSFSPLGDEELRKYGHRNTRDTDWPQDSEEERQLIEKFNDPSYNEEPSCEELKKMWRLARKLQRNGSGGHPSLFYNSASSSHSKMMEDKLNKEESKALLLTSPKKMKTDRRRLSVIPSNPSFNDNDEEDDDEGSRVYGKVSQFQPNIKVHDPTNDIYKILRSRKERQINHLKSLRMRANQNEIGNYGNVRYYESPPQASAPSSYMDKLRSKLREDKGLNPSIPSNDQGGDGFDGYLIQSEPLTQAPTHFDLLRLQLLSRDKANDVDSMAAFQTIKNSLMDNRIKQRINDKARKGIRRKNSRKRRKNKKRRNRRNRKNGRHRNLKRTLDEEPSEDEEAFDELRVRE